MKLSVCLDALYKKEAFYSGMEEIKACGMDAFEFWSWWDKDITRIRSEAGRLGLTVAAMCTKFIPLTDAGARDDYRAGLRDSIEAAKTLCCRRLISQVGSDIGIIREAQHLSIVEGLKSCAPMLEEAGIDLVIEPLNTKIDHKGYYLERSAEAFEIADEVDSPRVKVLFDIYHQQITEGDLLRNISGHIDRIGHFHAAGNPGRHELDRSEINYPYLLGEIDRLGYEGYVGLEYFPLDAPAEGLRKLAKGI